MTEEDLSGRQRWITTSKDSIDSNKEFARAVMAQPRLRKTLSEELRLLQRAVDSGQMTQSQALKQFKRITNDMRQAIEKNFGEITERGQPNQTDLTNSENMALALQNPSSIANNKMVVTETAIQESMRNEAAANIEAANMAAANLQNAEDAQAADQQNLENTEAANNTSSLTIEDDEAALDLVAQLVENTIGKGEKAVEKEAEETFNALSESFSLDTKEVEETEEKTAKTPFDIDFKPRPDK